MLSKKIALMGILVLTISFFTVYAHQAPDPGPSIIEGDIANMSSLHGIEWGYSWTSWSLTDTATDSQNNTMLKAVVNLTKQLHYDAQSIYFATTGTAIASVAATATVSGFETHGDYYIKAKARGRWWYRSEKLKNSYRGGTSKSVSKSAGRFHGNPTYSGVHLWGKAEIDNQFDDVVVVFEWL